MSTKLALTIGAVFALIFGLGLTFAPETLLGGFGIAIPTERLVYVYSRDLGVTLIGLGIINWLARDATGGIGRGLLMGNAFVQVAEAVVNGWEVAAGILPSNALAGVVLHVVLLVIFAMPLRRA